MTDDAAPEVPATPPRRRGRLRRALPWLLLLLGWVWLGDGFVSSNDGSHVALARALALRRTTTIDPDVALTLWVDRAERDGHHYSDRPPGTAFAAIPAVWLGALLDPSLRDRAIEQGEMVISPAGPAYGQTYVARAKKFGRAPALVQYQGTALAVRLHAALMGLLGLLLLRRWLQHHGLDRGAQRFALFTVAVATLWGPYSTMLFSHVTSGTLWLAMLVACSEMRDDSRTAVLVAGLFGAWAVASDYLLVVPIALHLGLAIPWRRWGWLLLGAAPAIIATGAYHHAAFGSVFSIGYDHHAAFEFARARSETFSGNLLHGLWTLLGLGQGAGVLALSPVLALGFVGLAQSRVRRWALPLVPWLLLLALHRTPEGGASVDHRYLVPAVPILGLGIALAWQRWLDHGLGSGPPWRRRAVIVVCIAIALASCAMVWAHSLAWRR
ncbi:MAG: hypothetical protein K1X88_00585 [Nannocystaceae bacterium]|nr:hypothetical protein [Nannocystaceae bacterium]